MSGHFAAIGFDFADQASFRDGLGRVGGDAVQVAQSPGAIHLQWLDASGASVAFHLDARSRDIACITPFFAPPEPTVWTVRSRAPLDDARCHHCGGAACDVLAADGEIVTRAGIQWLCFQPYRDWLRHTRSYPIEVVAFARSVEVFADVAALAAAPSTRVEGSDGHLTAESFVAVGLFQPGRDVSRSATVRATGRIHAAARLDNTGSGGWFWRIRIDTVPGALDVVASGDAVLGEPRVGAPVLIDAWLVGRPVDAPPAPRLSLWQRLRGA
jgi:hypothetical protein